MSLFHALFFFFLIRDYLYSLREDTLQKDQLKQISSLFSCLARFLCHCTQFSLPNAVGYWHEDCFLS